MRRLATAVAMGAAGLVWFLRPAPVVAVDPVSDGISEGQAPERPARDGPLERSDVRHSVFHEQIDQVSRDCGLELKTACEGGVCASVAEVPPLDHPAGWAVMAWRSPSLVAAVVAGDLGLPDRSLPCRTSVRGLGQARIHARATGSGEFWCLVDGAESAGELCDRLAGFDVGGFSEGTDRIVELRAPGT